MSAAGRLGNSQSRTTTPTRAFTSTILSRSSQSVPPASVTFEPLVKSVLRHRLLYNIFAYSFLFSWVQTALWLVWIRGGINALGIGGCLVTPVLPMTVVLACVNWAVAALPVIILRKVELTGGFCIVLMIKESSSLSVGTRTSASSPAKILQTAIIKRSTLRALLTYMLSAMCILIIHAWVSSTFDTGNPRLTLFVRSK